MKPETLDLLDLAQHAIHATELLIIGEEPRFAVGRAYYAMFYCAEALLHERGLHFRSHHAVVSAFGEQFAKTHVLDPTFHRWLIAAGEKRSGTDYDARTTADRFDAELFLKQARDFLAAARAYLEANPS
jgi:uncharacterized protein (UPF0332 family)